MFVLSSTHYSALDVMEDKLIAANERAQKNNTERMFWQREASRLRSTSFPTVVNKITAPKKTKAEKAAEESLLYILRNIADATGCGDHESALAHIDTLKAFKEATTYA